MFAIPILSGGICSLWFRNQSPTVSNIRIIKRPNIRYSNMLCEKTDATPALSSFPRLKLMNRCVAMVKGPVINEIDTITDATKFHKPKSLTPNTSSTTREV